MSSRGITLVIIPARGGSKGVVGKNIKLLDGKPLIQYTIEAALAVVGKEDIVVSTDSQEIKAVVTSMGIHVPFIRPAELATDTAGTHDVLLHALSYCEDKGVSVEKILLLQPTSPFRTAEQIKEALALYHSELDMVVSVKQTAANPYYVLREENEKGYLEACKKGNFVRRQDCPKVWEINGAIYIINPDSLRLGSISEFENVLKYEMDETSSLDIDSMLDWALAEVIVRKMD